jgi:capsid assembly protease
MQRETVMRTFSAQPWAMEPRRRDAFIEALCRDAAAGPGATVAEGRARPLYQVTSGVAVIDVVGPILKGVPDWIRKYVSVTDTEELRAAVSAALDDRLVRSIMLWIDSPGGTVSGVQQAADAVFAARGKKPIVAAVDDLCCSAAYWIASQADAITANLTATVGSIGVYVVADDYSRLYENAGISTHVFASGPAKGQGTEYSERATPTQMDSMRSEVMALAEIFVAAVARGRGISVEGARRTATGEYWLGPAAKARGLIDEIEDAQDVLAVMASPSMRR